MLCKTDSPAFSIHISGEFWLLIGWFVLSCGWKPMVEILSAAMIHEAGHLLALKKVGAAVNGICINALGAVLEADQSRLSYIEELIVLLAGPAANLICAGLLTFFTGSKFAVLLGANLILCGFNLLPGRLLDGGRALKLLLIWLTGLDRGELAAEVIYKLTAVLIAFISIYVVWKSGGSLWLLPACGSFLWQNLGDWGKNVKN